MAIALITGTSTGIGLATAVALGRAGHDVYATMRSPHHAPELRTIATKEALPITIHPLDVDDDGLSGRPSNKYWRNGGGSTYSSITPVLVGEARWKSSL
jgi:NAD(P)-dependent dehydrogenase (short-subunit alcohol dehydrogenase family)